MAKNKAKTTKKPTKPAKVTAKAPRRLKESSYKSFRVSKRIKPDVAKLSSAWHIMKTSFSLLKKNKKLFLGITLVYGILTVILVRGLGGQLNLTDLKENLTAGLNGNYSQIGTAATLFSYLLGSAGSSSTPTGGVYQTLLIIIVSLAVIWSLRQVLAGHAIRIRDGFYKGMYPLIPFMLVLFVIGLQLIPLLLGSWMYSVVVTNGIAANGVERIMWLLVFMLLALLSLYMICSSVFALYIVTLPEMTPMKALRSARDLVRYRRWLILRKLLFLPFALLLLGAVIMFPLILFLTPLAEWIFFLLTMFVVVVAHTYIYNLYRELL